MGLVDFAFLEANSTKTGAPLKGRTGADLE